MTIKSLAIAAALAASAIVGAIAPAQAMTGLGAVKTAPAATQSTVETVGFRRGGHRFKRFHKFKRFGGFNRFHKFKRFGGFKRFRKFKRFHHGRKPCRAYIRRSLICAHR
ncbi:MAG: hypothetical protein AAFR04_14595 [Pseudomonadota bacterium]